MKRVRHRPRQQFDLGAVLFLFLVIAFFALLNRH
jgi:hypothetical protein